MALGAIPPRNRLPITRSATSRNSATKESRLAKSRIEGQEKINKQHSLAKGAAKELILEAQKEFKNDKINETIGLEANLGELPQVQKYDVGEQFKAHTDYFENVEYNNCHLAKGGQRTWTFMVYLNDVEEGGETNFPKLQLEFKPQQGKALIWNNLINNEKENVYTLHQGKPIIKGVKYIITKWYREKNG